MQLFMSWTIKIFSIARRAITLGSWDLANRTESGLKISKTLHMCAWLSFGFFISWLWT